MDSLKIDFVAEPFHSAPKLLARSAAVFFGNLPRVAALTLLVFLPAKLVLQWLCSLFDVGDSQVLAYAESGLSDLVLGTLVTPAVVYLLVARFRGRQVSIGEALGWGRFLWGKSLWNEIKMEVTVMLWGALIIIPGVVVMVRLAFTDVVVAVEGKRTGDVLNRSRELAAGRWWRIAFVLLVLGVVELLVWGGLMEALVLDGPLGPRYGMALTDSLMAVVTQWTVTATLLMYLGIGGEIQPKT